MTCAKRHVTCYLVGLDGMLVIGTNSCKNPQLSCPRLPGEDYTKCKTICDQPGHAEMQALEQARRINMDLSGGMAITRGVDWICHDCGKALHKAGISEIKVII